MYIVAKDGSGDFTSLQAAVDAVPAGKRTPVILLVRRGIYEEADITVKQSGLRIVGADRAETVIVCRSFRVTGDRVAVENLTIRRSDGAEETPLVCAAGEDGREPEKRTPTWFLCGDSTMCDYGPGEAPRMGWGQALKELVTDVYVENCASSGRSSKSFVDERRLENVEACLRSGDRLFIQFGHNDEKPDLPRATTPWETYPQYLNLYINAALKAGAEPILLTSIARRHFDENGVLKHTHGEYPAAMRALAAQRGLRLLDMEQATEQLLQSLGDEPSKALFNWQEPGHPNYPDGVQDNTHLCREGALQLAKIALQLLAESGG